MDEIIHERVFKGVVRCPDVYLVVFCTHAHAQESPTKAGRRINIPWFTALPFSQSFAEQGINRDLTALCLCQLNVY